MKKLTDKDITFLIFVPVILTVVDTMLLYTVFRLVHSGSNMAEHLGMLFSMLFGIWLPIFGFLYMLVKTEREEKKCR